MNNYIKKIILITSDYLSIFIATYLTASLIENIVISKIYNVFLFYSFLSFIVIFPVFYLLGNYSYINKFFKTSNVIRIIIGIVISFILLGSLNLVISHFQIKIYFRDTYLLSPKFTIINMCLIGFLIINSRFLLSLFSKIRAKEQINFWENKKRIYVYGAGNLGIYISENINFFLKGYNVEYFIDDDLYKRGRTINNIPIISFSEFKKTHNKHKINELILAIKNIESVKKKKILQYLSKNNIKLIDGINFLNENKKDISQIKKEITKNSDFNLNQKNEIEIQEWLKEKTILVTGCAGTIGKELCFQILKYRPKKLICLDNDEHRISIFNREVSNYETKISYQKILTKIIDLKDHKQLEKIFLRNRPDTIFHAAASKHVDLIEKNPEFGVKNNLLTTFNILELSKKYNTKNLIFISTDKAVNPKNYLGLSKAACEVMVKIYARSLKKYNYCSVRFGNVLGSSGSLVEIITTQIHNGNPVTITNPKATRYFMSISDAIKLTLRSSTILKVNEIAILDMGKPVNIAKFVRRIVRNYGYLDNFNQKIKINYIGLRKGEKLHEELYYKKYSKKIPNEKMFLENKPTRKSFNDLKNLLKSIEDEKNFHRSLIKEKLVNFIN